MRLEIRAASLEDPRVVYALVRLHADAPPGDGAGGEQARRPVNLALVIDRSSSMRGPRIAQAALATRRVVERLGERDRLAVVAFDSAARVLLPPGPVTAEARAKVLAELDKLDTGAGTNLAAGWKKGCELVSAGFVRDAVARVVLLTDGLPSVGMTGADKLGAIAESEAGRGVTTTAMGIGENFDDELLGEIARRGKGGFHYLATPESIPAAFGRELAGVFAIAATRVEIKVVTEPEVSTCEVLHRLTTRATPDGLPGGLPGGLIVEIGEIASGAPRQLLLRMVRGEAVPGKLLAKLAVTYDGPGGASGEPHLDRISAPQVPAPEDLSEVVVEHLRLAVATAVDEAWARRASGRRKDALQALADVRSAIAGARDRGLAPAGALDPLVREVAEAEVAVVGTAADHEHQRRAARERSHITLLGHSVIRPFPRDPSEARGDDDE